MTTTAKVLSDEPNREVVHLSTRNYPGAVIKGLQLIEMANMAEWGAKIEDPVMSRNAITWLAERLTALRDNYDKVTG